MTALVHQRANAVRAAEKVEQDAAHDRARTVFEATGDIARIPTADRVAMSADQGAALTAQAEIGPTGHPAESDPEILFHLSRLPDQALQAEDLRLSRHKLSAEDDARLAERQRNPNTPAAKVARAATRVIGEVLAARGVDFATTGDPAHAAIAMTLNNNVAEAIALHDGPLDMANLRQIATEETGVVTGPVTGDETGARTSLLPGVVPASASGAGSVNELAARGLNRSGSTVAGAVQGDGTESNSTDRVLSGELEESDRAGNPFDEGRIPLPRDEEEPGVSSSGGVSIEEDGPTTGLTGADPDFDLPAEEQKRLLQEFQLGDALFGDQPEEGILDEVGGFFGRPVGAALDAFEDLFSEPLGPSEEFLNIFAGEDALPVLREFNRTLIKGVGSTLDTLLRIGGAPIAMGIAATGQAVVESGGNESDSRRLMRDLWGFAIVAGVGRRAPIRLPTALPRTVRGTAQVVDRKMIEQTANDFLKQAQRNGTLSATLRGVSPAERDRKIATIRAHIIDTLEIAFARPIDLTRTGSFQKLQASHRPVGGGSRKNRAREKYDNSAERYRAIKERGPIDEARRGQPKEFFDQMPIDAFLNTTLRANSPEANIRRGLAAVDTVIVNQLSSPPQGLRVAITNAMYRPDVGDIGFAWGRAGAGNTFVEGYGLSHIIAKHGPEVVDKAIVAIALGKVHFKDQPGGRTAEMRYELRNQQGRISEIIVSLRRFGDGNRVTWMVTGYEDVNAKLASGPFNLELLTGPMYTRSPFRPRAPIGD